MADERDVDFYEISDTRSVLGEIEADLTVVQLARFKKQIDRLQRHGWKLNGDYFGNVEGCKEKLREFRLTLDKVDYRLLFCEEGKVFVVLRGYKEKRNGISKADIEAAEQRIREWRRRRTEALKQTHSGKSR